MHEGRDYAIVETAASTQRMANGQRGGEGSANMDGIYMRNEDYEGRISDEMSRALGPECSRWRIFVESRTKMKTKGR